MSIVGPQIVAAGTPPEGLSEVLRQLLEHAPHSLSAPVYATMFTTVLVGTLAGVGWIGFKLSFFDTGRHRAVMFMVGIALMLGCVVIAGSAIGSWWHLLISSGSYRTVDGYVYAISLGFLLIVILVFWKIFGLLREFRFVSLFRFFGIVMAWTAFGVQLVQPFLFPAEEQKFIRLPALPSASMAVTATPVAWLQAVQSWIVTSVKQLVTAPWSAPTNASVVTTPTPPSTPRVDPQLTALQIALARAALDWQLARASNDPDRHEPDDFLRTMASERLKLGWVLSDTELQAALFVTSTKRGFVVDRPQLEQARQATLLDRALIGQAAFGSLLNPTRANAPQTIAEADEWSRRQELEEALSKKRLTIYRAPLGKLIADARGKNRDADAEKILRLAAAALREGTGAEIPRGVRPRKTIEAQKWLLEIISDDASLREFFQKDFRDDHDFHSFYWAAWQEKQAEQISTEQKSPIASAGGIRGASVGSPERGGVRWGFEPPASMPSPVVESQSVASLEQIELATQRAHAALEKYQRSTVRGVIGVPVADRSFMLFDGSANRLLEGMDGRIVYRLSYKPEANSWVKLGNYQVLFLSERGEQK